MNEKFIIGAVAFLTGFSPYILYIFSKKDSHEKIQNEEITAIKESVIDLDKRMISIEKDQSSIEKLTTKMEKIDKTLSKLEGMLERREREGI